MRAGAVREQVAWPRSADACRRGASASVVARGPTIFLAATAPRPTARPWCLVACRRRSSIPASLYSYADRSRRHSRHQDYAARKASLTCPAQLLERDLRLGLEADPFRHTRLAPTFAILSPVLRQIQPIGHRQACMVISNRQRHRDLTI